MKIKLRPVALLAASALALAACGSDEKAAEPAAPAATEAPAPASEAPAPEVTDAPAPDATDAPAPAAGGEVGVSLILKNTSNPFFVSMKKDAEANAERLGVKLTVAAGKEDGDTQSQIDAIEAAVANGDKGILITPSGDAVVPAIEAAREAGLFVIALDTPPNPATSVDITFATDNFLAGQLIGKWAAAKLGGEKATIAMLDLFNDQVVSVDTQRDQGFLVGMGIIDELDPSANGKEPATGSYSGGDYEVVCHEPTNGAVDGGKSAMEACLAANPDINVVYTINEPAAQGAYDVLQAAGKEAGVIIVSVDGGCDPGLRLVGEGVIGATAQQYPGKMASLGMEAIKKLADGGAAPEVTAGLDFFNTGVALVTADPQDGVDSISVDEGNKLCWGEPAAAGGAAAAGGEEVGVSLILKNTSNPFFVSMKNDAEANAKELNVKLTVAAGKEDGDTQSQIDAIEAAVANGDKGILITPSGDAVVPAIEAAREAGLLVIALDTPPNPASSVDITFATDNFLAGQLIGQWAAAQLGSEKATIAMLDLFNDQVVSVDTQRDQGFLVGMGIIDELDPSANGKEPATGSYSGGEYEVVCHEPTNGAVDGGKSAMEACLAANPDINVVYTINEPAAQGAYDVLKAAGKEAGVIIVSVDGGCDPGLRLVAEGVIGATAQQYPGKMASLGMKAIRDLADGGAKPAVTAGLDFFNTGVALVTDKAVDGVESISVAEGNEICWG